MKQFDIFDVEERLARLSGLGNKLKAFCQTFVDFEVFHPDLKKDLVYLDGSKGGRSNSQKLCIVDLGAIPYALLSQTVKLIIQNHQFLPT